MSPRQHFRRLASLFYAKKCLPKFIVGLTSTAIKTHHSPADASRQPTALVRKRCAEDFELPPKKSRRLIFMVSEVMRLNITEIPNQNGLQTKQSLDTAVGNGLQSLRDRKGGKLVIIQSIFELTRCYLALSDFDKARITLQELSDANNGAVIWWGHSHFSELASLHSEIKVNSGEERDTIDVSLQRGMLSKA
ncbi:hypothetical protein MJO29_015677 [Puccinia striiformis f. sp. tritici]|nr:hypothetical protein MJO29_015677 [Puccinia striiformis f. sp. tritici]